MSQDEKPKKVGIVVTPKQAVHPYARPKTVGPGEPKAPPAPSLPESKPQDDQEGG